jgi:hypothetical protein
MLFGPDFNMSTLGNIGNFFLYPTLLSDKDGYGALATLSSRKGFYGFQIRPKFHMLGHIV